jgi:hypothetical protein
MHAAYKDKVETLLKEFRSNGGNPSRDDVLALALGRDMRDGKVKSSVDKSAPKGNVSRGSTPGARSDVSSSGRNSLSEAEKREKRLEGVRI